MRSLKEIGVRHGTDKANEGHSFRGVSYLDVYQRHFEPIRHHVRRVVEIGVYRGASLRTWEEYFPKARIHGIDIDPAVAFHEGRIVVHTVDQSDEAMLAMLFQPDPIDIVIDDGSHLVEHMVASFRALWPQIAPGGWYCIEDLAAIYHDLTPWVKDWPGQGWNKKGTDFRNDAGRFTGFLAELMRPMHFLQGEVAHIGLWPAQVLIQKAA